MPQPSKRRAQLQETRDVLTDPDLMRQIAQSKAFYRSGQKGLSFEEAFGEPLVPEEKRSRRGKKP